MAYAYELIEKNIFVALPRWKVNCENPSQAAGCELNLVIHTSPPQNCLSFQDKRFPLIVHQDCRKICAKDLGQNISICTVSASAR